MGKATQPVTVGDIEFDALISSEHTLETTVPQYAVETGFSVSDVVIFNPEQLSLVLYVTNTPVTWYSEHGGDSTRVDTVVAELQELYYTGEPVTITTSDDVYTDMVIESLTISKTLEDGYAREIPITFTQVRKTSSSTTTIPSSYGKSGTTTTSAGTSSTSSGSTTTSTSSGTSSTTSSSSGSSTTTTKDNYSGSVLYNIFYG